MKNNTQKHFTVMKIVGVLGAVAFIAGIILTFIGFGDFETNNFMIGGFLATFGFMACAVGFMVGFRPEITKMSIKTMRHIQEENKDDLSASANNAADITSDAVTTTAKAVAEGIRDTIFCKHCGAKIDADSKFCSSCGKKL